MNFILSLLIVSSILSQITCHDGFDENTQRLSKSAIINEIPATNSTYTIYPNSNQHCQIRLDFNDFILDDPIDGDCPTAGRFTVSGQWGPNPVPILCGEIGGPELNQHMYLTFKIDPSASTPEPIVLSILTNSSSSVWDMTVTQIMCNDQENLAPSGCLQYYPESSGTIQSFNYQTITTEEPTETNQLNNMNYKICLDATATMVNWTRISTKYSFFLSETPTPLVSASGTAQCRQDYVFIRNGIPSGFTEPSERYCGNFFPFSVTSDATPVEFIYITDEAEISPFPDELNNGFKLNFSVF